VVARPTRSQPARYGVLLIVALAGLFVQGVVSPGGGQQVLVTALAAATLVLALRAAEIDRRLILAAAVLGALCIAVALVRATAGGIGAGPARLMNALLVALGPPVIAVGVVRDLRATGQVRVEAVMGVLALYILVGMLFAFVYGAIDVLGDAPFFADGAAATASHCLYFSFTTLTTVGYGDFVAQGDLGHTLAIFEALIGQIYLVTVVSVFVGNLRPRRISGSS
jgi:hypothetical protein